MKLEKHTLLVDEDTLFSMFSNIVDIVFLMKYERPASFRYVRFSSRAKNLAGLHESDLGKTFEDIYQGKLAEFLTNRYLEAINRETPVSYIDEMNTIDSELKYVETVLIPIKTKQDTYVVGLTRDITTEYKTITHDPVTQLAVPKYFRELVKEQSLLNEDLHIIYISFDQLNILKTIDEYYLNNILKIISTRLQEQFPNVPISITEDKEFIVAFSGDPSTVYDVSVKTKSLLEQPIPIMEDEELSLSVYIGISYEQEDLESYIKNAYKALLTAQTRKLNTPHIFLQSDKDLLQYLKKKTLAVEIEKALLNNEFDLHYQPKYIIQSKKYSAEALIRWNSKSGMVNPNDFIPVAEETDLIIKIGYWVIEEVCQSFEQLQSLGLESVAVNISPKHFEQEDFPCQIMKILDKYEVPSSFIELEITENSLLNVENTIDTLNRLRSLGFKLVLDDFGIFYSTLSYLKNLPLHKIKIDRSFISKMEEDQHYKEIVKMIIRLAKSLQLEITAEGIEDQAQRTYLEELGCDELQGYLFSKPVPLHLLKTAIGSS